MMGSNSTSYFLKAEVPIANQKNHLLEVDHLRVGLLRICENKCALVADFDMHYKRTGADEVGWGGVEWNGLVKSSN
jgi:hypothetical protein